MNRIVLNNNNYNIKRAKNAFDKFFFLAVEYYKKSNLKQYNGLREPLRYDYACTVPKNLKIFVDFISQVIGNDNIVIMISIWNSCDCEEGVYYLNVKDYQIKRIKLVSDKLKEEVQGYNVCISLLISVEESTIDCCTRRILDDLLVVGAVQQKVVEVAKKIDCDVLQYTKNVLAFSKEIGINKAHLYLITNVLLKI